MDARGQLSRHLFLIVRSKVEFQAPSFLRGAARLGVGGGKCPQRRGPGRGRRASVGAQLLHGQVPEALIRAWTLAGVRCAPSPGCPAGGGVVKYDGVCPPRLHR